MKGSIKILLLLFILTLGFAQPAAADELQQTNTIETSATSQITVDPDIAQLSLTVRTEENSAALAQENNAVAVTKAMDLLISEGLTNDEIKTTNYSTYSYTKSSSDKNTGNDITVYAASSGLEVKFKELDKAGEILDKLASISEVNVNSVNYSVQDPEKYKEQVISSAIAAAKQNILYSATALGVTLDKLNNLRIDFNANPISPIFPRNSVAFSAAPTPQPQNPDKVTISATADMSYSVEQ